MIDLTSKTVDEINSLVQKYATILVLLEPKEQAHFAAILEVAIPYIKDNYSDLNTDWKAWAVVSLKKQHHKIHKESDIKKLIDDFIEYYKTEYQNYIDNLGMYASEYDRDCGFVHAFLNKKIGG